MERFNRTPAERLFGAQYAQEMLLTARESSERSSGTEDEVARTASHPGPSLLLLRLAWHCSRYREQSR